MWPSGVLHSTKSGSLMSFLALVLFSPRVEKRTTNYAWRASKIKMGSTPSAIVTHTHGYRYGIKAVIQHSRNYASGNGALAAKMTLMGDPRGSQLVSFNSPGAMDEMVASLQASTHPL